MVEVADVSSERAAQMALTHDCDVVQALSAQAAREALTDGVCVEC